MYEPGCPSQPKLSRIAAAAVAVQRRVLPSMCRVLSDRVSCGREDPEEERRDAPETGLAEECERVVLFEVKLTCERACCVSSVCA